MKESEKKQLQQQLANLDGHERHRLMKKALQLRKATQPRPTRTLDDDFEAPTRRKQSLDDILWELVKHEQPRSETLQGQTGMILSLSAGKCEVLGPDGPVACRLTPELASMQQTLIAVGDEANFAQRGSDFVVDAVAPRRTKLSRPDPHLAGQERIIVANIDLVVVVCSVVNPPLRTGLLDRYLVAIQRGGAQMAIALNKLDLLQGAEREAELAKLAPYRSLGAPIAEVSAQERDGLDELKQVLQGKLSAFVGHSGVGKSSLLNALKPDLNLDTGSVSEGYGRGTHTTTSSTLWDLGDGTRVIDTPGIRSFGLFKLKPDELVWYFPEFEGFRCKFRDCSHVQEPKCGVRDAVDMGLLSQARYDAYLRIRESLG